MDKFTIEDDNLPPPPQPSSDEFVTGMALSGDYVKGLVDKKFTIVGARTQDMPDLSNPGMRVKKTILSIQLSHNKTITDYIPNKSSIKSIITKKGYRLSDWIGHIGEFYTAQQRIGNGLKDVIYIKD